ncbi:MAG TPA: hypothetical protein VK151_14115 [Fluviicola sp.]|nr:hypothetical protein [Fluviicola sp.]
MESYATLTEAMDALRKQGYTEDFNLSTECIRYGENKLELCPNDFQVDKFFRFEGHSNPDDSEILYAIASNDRQIKGVLVNSYGIYSDPVADELMKKLEIHS